MDFFWAISGPFPGHFWAISGSFLGHFRAIYKKFLGWRRPRSGAGAGAGTPADFQAQNPRQTAGSAGGSAGADSKNPRRTAGGAGAGVGLAGGYFPSKPPGKPPAGPAPKVDIISSQGLLSRLSEFQKCTDVGLSTVESHRGFQASCYDHIN